MIDGLPLHPLLVHAAVVLLAVNGGVLIVAAVVPQFRRWLSWGLPALGVLTAVTTWVTRLEGEKFLGGREMVGVLGDHAHWGAWAGIVSIILGITTVVFWLSSLPAITERLPWLSTPVVRIVLAVLAIGVGVTAITVDILAGHSGATSVWG